MPPFREGTPVKHDCRPGIQLRLEQLEDRLAPSWGSVPPGLISIPSFPVQVKLNTDNEANGATAITANEVDWYRFRAVPGSYTFSTNTPASALDTVIGVYNAAGRRVAFNDDASVFTVDSQVTVSLGAGVYYFGVTNYSGSLRGSYDWAIDGPSLDSPPQPPPPPPPPVGKLQVANTAQSVGEGKGTVAISVNRFGGSEGIVSVQYSTTNGSAVQPGDYVATSGTLTWEDGDTSTKTIIVPIVDDSLVELSETFSLSLSNPTGGATLGSSQTTIIISDNDSPPPSAGGFNITLRMTGMTMAQRAIFQQAADRWAQIIIGDLPHAMYLGTVVDDLLIDASATVIDGEGGALGSAEPDRFRPGTFLPYHGVMRFDIDDMEWMESSGLLYSTVLHEMGHILGIGTIWSDRGLIAGENTSDPIFIGPQATAVYNTIFGTSAPGVPVESSGGPGTRDAHWRESVLGNEIMTGWIDDGFNPLSWITVASMADLGYQVNLFAGDAYVPNGNPLFGGGSSGGGSGDGGGNLRRALPPSSALPPQPNARVTTSSPEPERPAKETGRVLDTLTAMIALLSNEQARKGRAGGIVQ